MWDFLDQLIRSTEAHLKCGWHISVTLSGGSPDEGKGKREAAFCLLLALTLADKFVHLVAVASLR